MKRYILWLIVLFLCSLNLAANCQTSSDKVDVDKKVCQDSDNDKVCDIDDQCYLDSNKTLEGQCGCGVADTDTDKDGTADCNDLCPVDSQKKIPGLCGCGIADSDTDKDGTADCIDECYLDSKKILKGQCGCGVADTDTDKDGTADCNDLCPVDSQKKIPGLCGCGISETDTDKDGTADCIDECYLDSKKSLKGQCGCGVADVDTDKDGTADCNDLCPVDSQKKIPGLCGCGIAETDQDNDGTPDCNDLCPKDSLKIKPLVCGCGVTEKNSDFDDVLDCLDECPYNDFKSAAGICGCNYSDEDYDGDGFFCDNDECYFDPNKQNPGICGCYQEDILIDSDKDGIIDCNDRCPYDPAKSAPGICGCGYEDNIDVNNDGVNEKKAYYLQTSTKLLASGLTAIILAYVDDYRSDTSIIVDSHKIIHVLFRGKRIFNNIIEDVELVYANNSNSVWKAEVLGYVGTYHSMALDINDDLHIATSSNFANELLFYLSNASGKWVSQIVDNSSSVGLENDIVVGADGYVHIAYWQWSGASRYSTNASGQWQTYLASENFGSSWQPHTIILDNNNTAHVYYSHRKNCYDEYGSIIGYGVYNYEYVNSESLEQIKTINNNCSDLMDIGAVTSAVLGESNVIYIATSKELLILNNGSLSVEDIYQKMGAPFGILDEDALAVDQNGKLHLTFLVWTSTYQSKIYYASNVLGTWKAKIIDEWDYFTDNEAIGANKTFAPGITTDKNNQVYIIYVNSSSYPFEATVNYVKFDPIAFLSAP